MSGNDASPRHPSHKPQSGYGDQTENNRRQLNGIFFSLKGTLSRQQWSLAMIVATSVFIAAISIAGDAYSGRATTELIPSWLLLLLSSIVFICVVSIICAKRLLNCHRPVWLALTVPFPNCLLALSSATDLSDSWPLLTVTALQLSVFSLPAVIACALYDAAD